MMEIKLKGNYVLSVGEVCSLYFVLRSTIEYVEL